MITLRLHRCGDLLHRGEYRINTDVRCADRVLELYAAEAEHHRCKAEFWRLNLPTLRALRDPPARLRAAIEHGEAITMEGV